MARPIKLIEAESGVVKELRRRSRAATSMVRERERADIILGRLEGLAVSAVAKRLGTTPKRVSAWSKRFEEHGLAGLDDKIGRAARVITDATRPPKTRTRWSLRTMARHAGVSPSSVRRIWSQNGLKPHVVKTFKLSNDPNFEEKFWDVICKSLDLTRQTPRGEIAACLSSLGGEFGARIDSVKDARFARAGAAGAIARCIGHLKDARRKRRARQRAFLRTPYGILDRIEAASPIMPAVS